MIRSSPRVLRGALAVFLAMAGTMSAAEAPQLRFLKPAAGDLPVGDTVVEVAVIGDQPGDVVDFFADGQKVGRAASGPWKVDWQAGGAPSGHVLTAVLVRGGREVAVARLRTRAAGFVAATKAQAVSLSPIVLDRAGHYTTGLTKEDFSLTVDGKPHPIDTFDAVNSRLLFVLVLDVSASMAPKLTGARAAALALLDALKPVDEASVLTFNSNVVGLTELATDRSRARRALVGARVSGETALYDATAFALRKLKERHERGAVVLFTDGADNRSRLSVEQVIEMAGASEASIFAVAQGVREDAQMGGFLRQMAQDTGGRAFFISSIRTLTRTFDEVVSELQHQYYLTFTPPPAPPRTWHEVKLRVRRSDLRVRVRKSYFLE